MRALSLLVGLGLVTVSTGAGADVGADRGASFSRLIEREQQTPALHVRHAMAKGVLPALPAPMLGLTAVSSALDCVHARHEITLDPRTGVTSASLDLTVRANGKPLSAIGLSFDSGLAIDSVNAGSHAISFSDAVVLPTRITQIVFSPALQDGEQAIVHVGYSGTLACSAAVDSGAVLCTMGQDFSYFSHQSVIPFLFDPAALDDAMLDSMTRDIVLRVPNGIDVVSTGERVSDTSEGGAHVSTWTVDRPLSRALGMYVFAGKLGFLDVPGRTTPTTLVYPAPQAAVDQRLASWSVPVLDFVEKLGGTALPFQRSMTLVRLPTNVGDPGTATFGMTLLSEKYEAAGDLMHEETWSHENSHLFWGIVVPETNPRESRLMSEGMATLSELDYTWASHFAEEDKETYLARRFVPIGLDLRSQDVPPVQVPLSLSPADQQGTSAYTMWAYYKGAAVLDHLRVTIGDDVFRQALESYVARCSYVGCRPDDLRSIIETITGKDLGPFWNRWVTANVRPDVKIGFTRSSSGAEVDLIKNDDEPMTLELWIRMDDGARVSKRVELAGRFDAHPRRRTRPRGPPRIHDTT